jgi:hypothetical protein
LVCILEKHGWILLKLVSVEKGMIENANRVKKSKKNSQILQYTNQVCIWSAFWKHGWILLKLGVHVSIGHCIIENENRVTGRIFRRQGDTYAVLGQTE